MVGQMFSGPRARQVFCSRDKAKSLTTYSRSCTIEQGEFVLVRVPWNRRGKPDLSKLSVAERRFVVENITPAEHKASGNGAPK